MVNGLPDDYEIAFNDEVWPNNQKEFLAGSVLTDITPSAEGYVFDPVSQDVTMDMDKTIEFDAVAAAQYAPLDTDWVPGDSAVVVTTNNLDYTASTRARNDKVYTSGSEAGFRALLGVYGGLGLGANDTSMSSRNEMFYGFVRSANNKVTFFSLGNNLFETSDAVSADALIEIRVDASNWMGFIDDVQVHTMAALTGDHKINSFGDADSFVHDIEYYNFN